MAFQAEPVDLKAILEETRLIAAPLAEHNGNDVVITGDPTAPWVLGDPHRLRQVLLNLVSNAAKFTRRGRVALDLAVRDRGPGTAAVELAVVDDGPGIPPADRARIFDDFVTLDSGYDRNTGGSGLGLAISRRIVRAMGGEIGVDPGPGGTGSRFWIRLALPYAPAAGDPAAPGAGRAAPEASPAGRRLLLVEDNEVNRMVAGEMLRQAGHAVTEAADGTAGIAAAAQRRFDLILMDVSMPGMDGVEATQAIRRGRGASRDSPVVALTAHALPEDRRRFAEAGMREVIVKPLRRADLLAAAARYPAADPDAAPPAPAPAPAPAAGGARAHTDEGADRGTDRDADWGPEGDADRAPDGDAEPDPLDQLFDTDVLSDLSFTLSPDALSRTLAKVRGEIDEALARVEDAAAARDDAALAHWVHRLAGCAAMVGARALHAACGEVEAACKRGAGAHARTRAGDLPELVAGSQAILAELAEDAAAAATAP
jgi:CheY-like chemotaxis protein/HPt (histidine-containing phosphotransfer) domain-containing protein